MCVCVRGGGVNKRGSVDILSRDYRMERGDHNKLKPLGFCKIFVKWGWGGGGVGNS